jgi:Leucine-rich repeat (LRR) protein
MRKRAVSGLHKCPATDVVTLGSLREQPNQMSLSDATAIARARIAEEVKRRTGSLNLAGLALDALPKEVSGLTALQHLDCRETQVSDLSPLASLTALQQLDCSDTQVSDLSPLASLTAL